MKKPMAGILLYSHFKKKSLFIYEQLRTLHVARGFSTVPSTLFSFGCREVSEKLTKKKNEKQGT